MVRNDSSRHEKLKFVFTIFHVNPIIMSVTYNRFAYVPFAEQAIVETKKLVKNGLDPKFFSLAVEDRIDYMLKTIEVFMRLLKEDPEVETSIRDKFELIDQETRTNPQLHPFIHERIEKTKVQFYTMVKCIKAKSKY